MNQDDAVMFEQCQIGQGVKPLAQHGTVSVGPATLTLIGTHGEVIDEAPIAEVTAWKIRFTRGKSIGLTLGDRKYNVSPGWGATVGNPMADTSAVATAGEQLLRLITDRGGRSR